MLSIIAAVLFATAPTGACEAARAEYESLSLESALEKAELELGANLDRPVECLEVKALALMVLGRSDEARSAFQDLFARDIDHVVSDRSLSPAQQQQIEEVREGVRPIRTSVKARWLVHDLLRLDVIVGGGLRGASGVRYELELRPEGAKQSGMVSLVGRIATATAAIPADANVATLVMSGRVIDAKDRTLHAFDTESILPPRPPPPERVGGDEGGIPWFVWAGIGASMIGGAVAIAILAQPGHPDFGKSAGGVEVP